MKRHIIGIIAGAVALISLVLPWWMLKVGNEVYVSWYVWGPNGVVPSGNGTGILTYIALILIVVCGILALLSSIRIDNKGKKRMLIAGISALLSIIIFAIVMISWIPSAWINVNSIFYSGLFDPRGGPTANAYLYFGFWIALIATILAFVAYFMYPKVEETAEATQPDTPE